MCKSNKFNLNSIKKIIGKECVLIIATILAIITSFFSIPKIEYINFKVIILLFNLMIVISFFRKLKVLDSLALFVLEKCKTSRSVAISLILVTFFVSMIATNDVSLLTFVPLTIIIGKKCDINMIKTIVLQTIAANIGSSLTPMGNPQNLYIYANYEISVLSFFKITIPVVILGLIMILISIFMGKNRSIDIKLDDINIIQKNKVYLGIILLIIILLSVFNIIDYRVAFIITILFFVIMDKTLFLSVDYSLIFIFISFFVFVGNISNMQIIKDFMTHILSNNSLVYITGIVLSQFISNVPACIMISGFTTSYKELLLGVNIGGLGTIIASLASLISYKLYVSSESNTRKARQYLIEFSKFNFIFLLLIGIVFFFVTI